QRQAAQGRKLDYDDLVDTVVEKRSPARAEAMRHFEAMYKQLKSGVFSDFSTQADLRVRFFESQKAGDTKSMHEAFAKHGGGSQEFRTAHDNLNKVNSQNARESLVDVIFAHDENLNPRTFDPTNLGREQVLRYQLYKAMVGENYDPATDKTVPTFMRPTLEKAFRKYQDNLAFTESLAGKRSDGALKDITRTHLNDFIVRHAPELANDVTQAYEAGRTRFDPLTKPDSHRLARILSQDEVVADFFKAYLRKEGLAAQGKPHETIDDLLEGSVGKQRAEQLKGFPELWKKLERDVFPAFRRMPVRSSDAIDTANNGEQPSKRGTTSDTNHPNKKTNQPDVHKFLSFEPNLVDHEVVLKNAIKALNECPLADAYLTAFDVPRADRTAEFVEAVNKRMLKELKNPDVDTEILSDMAKLIAKDNYSTELKNALQERAKKSMSSAPDSKSIKYWAELAKTLGVSKELSEPVSEVVKKALESKDRTKWPIEVIYELARDFDVLTSDSRRTICAEFIDRGLNGEDYHARMTELFKHDLAKDSMFRDMLADKMANLIQKGEVKDLSVLSLVLSSFPEQGITIQPHLRI
ncbi:MAG: hypothetical protein K2Z81_16515, partial [Cyanobacteria bacterium]|nr:hypothetical protein [Cyanobacteriota bacterium]